MHIKTWSYFISGRLRFVSTADATTLATNLVADADTNCDFKDLTFADPVYTGTVVGIGELDKKYAASGCINYEKQPVKSRQRQATDQQP